MTTFVHDHAATDRAVHISEALFSGDLQALSEQEIQEGFNGVPSHTIDGVASVGLIDLLVNAGISPSKRQAREDIKNGAVYVNGVRCTDRGRELSPADNLCGNYLVMRRGKRSYYLIQWAA